MLGLLLWALIQQGEEQIMVQQRLKDFEGEAQKFREGAREGGSRGRGYGDICIHVADSLCCTAETITTL